MTTYYNKVLEPVDSAVYSVNPAAYLGEYKSFGQWSVTIDDPWMTDWIHYNAVVSQNSMRVSNDEPMWADGSHMLYPAMIRLKFFSWSVTVTKKQFKSMETNPNGITAQAIKDEIESQQDYFAKKVDLWVMNRIAVTGTEDDAGDWNGFFVLTADTGTATAPADCSTAAGTETDLSAVVLSGTAQVVEGVQKSFGVTKSLFFQQYDSNTERSMYKQNNTFDIWGHPAAFEKVSSTHESNASGEIDYSLNTLDEIKKIGTVHPTMAVDAAYAGTTTTEASFVISMNTAENFKVVESIPYTITEWEKHMGAKGKTEVYRKMGYLKLGVMSRPFKIGANWKKACSMMKCEPYTNT